MTNKLKNKNWTTEDERIVQYQWASRTFTSTCLKLTMQNETIPTEIDKQKEEYMNKRNKTKKIQIYTFLENWYLHSMFNKSQKVLLGFTDIKPCVILSMDNFMFTPPPLLPSESGLYQSEMELIGMESKEEEIEDDDEEDIFNTTSSIIMSAVKYNNQEDNIFMDENTWMTIDNSSILSTTDENEVDDDDDDALVPYGSERSLKTSDLISWYQLRGNVSLHNCPSSTVIFDNNSDKTQSNIQSQQTEGSSWMQKIQYSFIFISKRLIETAYLVSELVESFTNKKNSNELIATTGHQQLEHHHSNIDGYYNCHSITGKCILFIFRIWRIFFLGIEIAINQLATTASIDNHSMLPKLLITSNAT